MVLRKLLGECLCCSDTNSNHNSYFTSYQHSYPERNFCPDPHSNSHFHTNLLFLCRLRKLCYRCPLYLRLERKYLFKRYQFLSGRIYFMVLRKLFGECLCCTDQYSYSKCNSCSTSHQHSHPERNFHPDQNSYTDCNFYPHSHTDLSFLHQLRNLHYWCSLYLRLER